MGVPPQEVSFDEKYTAGNMLRHTSDDQCLGSYKGLGHCVCWCRGLLQVPTNLSSSLKKLCSSKYINSGHRQSFKRDSECGKRRGLPLLDEAFGSGRHHDLFFHRRLPFFPPQPPANQTTLRNILGTKDLHQILSDRESISTSMQVDRLDRSLYQLDIKSRMVF